jgi:hypothetical protein
LRSVKFQDSHKPSREARGKVRLWVIVIGGGIVPEATTRRHILKEKMRELNCIAEEVMRMPGSSSVSEFNWGQHQEMVVVRGREGMARVLLVF